MQERKTKRMSQTQAAWLLLTTFLVTYGLFLVYPFFRGFWISRPAASDGPGPVSCHRFPQLSVRQFWGFCPDWD